MTLIGISAREEKNTSYGLPLYKIIQYNFHYKRLINCIDYELFIKHFCIVTTYHGCGIYKVFRLKKQLLLLLKHIIQIAIYILSLCIGNF